MSSEKPSDEFLRHHAERLDRASKDTSPLGDQRWAASMSAALTELLQRRKDGSSPEEFVVQMAAKAAEIKPQHRAHFLHCLGEIHRAVDCVRQYLAGKPE